MLTRYVEDDYKARPDEPSSEVLWAQSELNSYVWCSVNEAAKRVGKSYRTVYRLIEMNNKHIAFRKTDLGYIVYLPSVFKWWKKEFNREQSTSSEK